MTAEIKSHLLTLVIALVIGYFGGYLASLNTPEQATSESLAGYQKTTQNPFQIQFTADSSDSQLTSLQSQIQSLQHQVNELQSAQNKIKTLSKNNTHDEKNKINVQVTPNQKNLIASGISPDVADEILRRISQQDFRRLELQNLMQRSIPTERRQYSRELRELNKNRISLRSEMGDDSYDQYLFVSGQNNRVKVSSVMAGSPAETSGFQADDVILYYDNQKILSWPDIRRVTIQGEIGNYTSVEILRDGTQMSLMVPRGILGVQLDSVQLDPEKK